MPVETIYQYFLSDFQNNSVNVAQLGEEIRASDIVIALKNVIQEEEEGEETVVNITFKDELGIEDLEILDGNYDENPTAIGGLIAAHVAVDHTDPPETVTISDPVTVANPKLIVQNERPADSDGIYRVYAFSVDLADKCTWWYRSVYVQDENIGPGDGVEVNFDLDNDCLINLVHGKVTDEDLIPVKETDTTDQPVQWDPTVKVDGVLQTRREPYAASGGDYIIDYENGQIQFFTAPTNGAVITCSYFYSPHTPGSSVMEYMPPATKKWLINTAEAQFSKDIVMNDTIRFGVWVAHPLYGDIELTNYRTNYKTIGNMLDYSFGSLPIIPAIGGSARGTTQDTILLRWEYVASITVASSQLTKIRISLVNDVPVSGERATFTLYGQEETE